MHDSLIVGAHSSLVVMVLYSPLRGLGLNPDIHSLPVGMLEQEALNLYLLINKLLLLTYIIIIHLFGWKHLLSD